MTDAPGSAPVVIVGGGHNGLVPACYLAKAGRRVLVLEASDALGGGSRTDETIPATASHPLGRAQHHQHDVHPG